MDRPYRVTRPDVYGSEEERHVNLFEAAYLRRVLDRCIGNISRAAEAADVDRKTFYRLLRKHQLQPEVFRV